MSLKLNLNVDNPINFAFSRIEIEKAILKILQQNNLAGIFEVDLKFVSVQIIHKLNREYREIDKPTDVLSFPIHEKVESAPETPVLLGDIIICPEMAEDSIDKLISHSALHLIGQHHSGD